MFSRFADGGVVDDHQVKALCEVSERGVGEGLQGSLLPVDGDTRVGLLEALRCGEHGEQAAGVIPGDAVELDHFLLAGEAWAV